MKKCLIKKIFAVLFIVLVLALCITGCANKSLKKRVKELEQTVASMQDDVSKMKNEDTKNFNVENSFQNADVENREYYSQLYNLAHSQNYDDWMSVALNQNASEELLDVIAEKCEICGYEELAKTIVNNDNCTNKVVTTLSASCYYGVLKVVAESNKAGEASLINVARFSVDYEYIDLATIIALHPNTNQAVISTLANSKNDKFLSIVLDSGNLNEEILMKVAKTSVNNNYRDIALRVLSNPASTYAVYAELKRSSDAEISNYADIYYKNCLK